MEQAFKVKRESNFYKDTIAYFEDMKKEREFVLSFGKKHGIKGSRYDIGCDGSFNKQVGERYKDTIYFGIEATEEEISPLIKEFKKPVNGVYYLKKNSKILKEMKDLIMETGLVLNVKCFSPIDYTTDFVRRYSWNRFQLGDDLYVKLNIDGDYIFKHDEFDPIKISEYYQKLEEFKNE